MELYGSHALLCGKELTDGSPSQVSGHGGKSLSEGHSRAKAQSVFGLAVVVATVAGHQAHAVACEGRRRAPAQDARHSFHRGSGGVDDEERDGPARSCRAHERGQTIDDLARGHGFAVSQVIHLAGRCWHLGGKEQSLDKVVDV